MAAGAAGGAINSAYNGTNIEKGALKGAVYAGATTAAALAFMAGASYLGDISQPGLGYNAYRLLGDLPRDEKYADTRITWSGEIKVTHYNLYYDADPIVQQGVDVHETIHVQQFQPYTKYGWFGNGGYFFHGPEWEVQAYEAQYQFLGSKLSSIPFRTSQYEAVTANMSRVGQNLIEYRNMLREW